MPKSTFLNLRPEKQQIVTEAALKEFALHDYENASITNLVKTIGIAKGSIYQYFEQKKGLYQYLIELATEEKLTYTKKTIKKAGDGDFGKWFKKLLQQSLLFELENPRLGSLLKNVAQERHNQEVGNLALKNLKETKVFLEKVLELNQESGSVSKKLDLASVAMILTHASYGFTDGFYVAQGIDFAAHAIENEPVMGKEEEAKEYAKTFMKALAPIFL